MFSAIIPVYNHARFLATAILSALRSSLVSEVLLVDDGSVDGSNEEIWRLCESNPGRVRNLTIGQQGNLGAPSRLNQLVAEARSDWIAVLNSDDSFVAGRFEALHALLRRGHYSFAWGHLLIMDETGAAIGTKRGALEPEYPFPAELNVPQMLARGEFVELLANQNFIATTSNMVFTKRLHAQVRGFREYRYVHDWDFALRACALGKVLYTPQFMASYRVHASNTISQDHGSTQDEARQLFQRFEETFPQVSTRPAFEIGLRANRYVNAIDRS